MGLCVLPVWWAFGGDGTCGVKGEFWGYRGHSEPCQRGFAPVSSSGFSVMCSSEHGL